MLQAYINLEQAAAAEALDEKTRELIAIAVAIRHVVKVVLVFMLKKQLKQGQQKVKLPRHWLLRLH